MSNSPRSGECAVYGRNHEEGDCKRCKQSSTCNYFNRPSYNKLKAENEELKAEAKGWEDIAKSNSEANSEACKMVHDLTTEETRLREALRGIANWVFGCPDYDTAEEAAKGMNAFAEAALNHKEG